MTRPASGLVRTLLGREVAPTDEGYGHTEMVDWINSDELARSFSQRSEQLAWLLGAGASASANVPTGGDMIIDFKTRLYCEHTNLSPSEVDATDPIWLERITAHFDGAHGMPPAGDPGEYAAAFEAAFPEARDRSRYIESVVQQAKPSFAHRVFAALVTSGTVPCVFTTNFDPLIERSTVVTDELMPAGEQAHLTVGALDSVERAVRCVRDNSWPLLVKLHGDYQSDRLKNTPGELQEQDRQLRDVMVEALRRFGLVVAGYSGRDHSIMDALVRALDASGAMPGGLWWVTRPGEDLLPRVVDLLKRAETAGIHARIVESDNFDELTGDIDREFRFEGPLREHIDALRPQRLVEPVALPTVAASRFPALRYSALELIELPTEARSVSLETPATSGEARRMVREADVWVTAVARGRRLAAFGADNAVERAFAGAGGRLDGVVSLHPAEDSVDRGLVYEALVRAIARRRPLRPMLKSRGHQVAVRPPSPERNDDVALRAREDLAELERAYDDPLVGRVPSVGLPFAEALRIRIEDWDGRWFLVFEPFTWVELPRGSSDAEASSEAEGSHERSRLLDAAGDWRRERWARRYNRRWNSIIAAWAKFVAPTEETELTTHFFRGSGVNAVFRLSSITAWSSPGRSTTKGA